MFSISMPVRNGLAYLSSALTSLRAQDGLAHVAFCDASGRGEARDIAESFSDLIGYRRHSNSDDGQSAAINEGWRALEDPYVGWLNTDDVLFPGALRKVQSVFETCPDIDVVYGHAVFVDDSDQFIGYFPSIGADTRMLRLSCMICQPACFIRRRAVERVGPLATDLHYVMDWEFWLRLLDAGSRFHFIDAPLALVRNRRDAKTYAGSSRRRQEMDALLRRRTHTIERYQTLVSDWRYRSKIMGNRLEGLASGGLLAMLRCLAPRRHGRPGSIFGLSPHNNRFGHQATVILPVLRAGEFELSVVFDPGGDVTEPFIVSLEGNHSSAARTGSAEWRARYSATGPGEVRITIAAGGNGGSLKCLRLSPAPFTI
jgi:GT2 family glycosyltransferase